MRGQGNLFPHFPVSSVSEQMKGYDMQERMITSTDSIRQGKTALAVGQTQSDKYRIGSKWLTASILPHNTAVEEVNHFSRHTTTRGDILLLKSALGEPPIAVRVLDIRLVKPDLLAPDDFQALGYADLNEYMNDWGEVFGDRVWLMKIEPVEME